MIDLEIDTKSMMTEAMKITSSMKLVMGDQREMFRGFDRKLSTYLDKTFRKQGPGWLPLAPSTKAARSSGLKRGRKLTRKDGTSWSSNSGGWVRGSYYKRTKPLREAGPGSPIGVWTGKARRRVKVKGKANRRGYTKTFGKDDEVRKRLEWLHQRRPLYRLRAVDRMFKKHAVAWFDLLSAQMNKMTRTMVPLDLKRLAGRFK